MGIETKPGVATTLVFVGRLFEIAKKLKINFEALAKRTHQTAQEEISHKIDILRGVAILGVVLVHSSQLREVNQIEALKAIFSWGQYGVELFFVISGFLMGMLYRAKPTFSQTGFWKRRLARILPLWVFFAALAWAAWILDQRAIKGWAAYNELENRFSNEGLWIDQPIVAFFLTILFLGWLSPAIWTATVPGGWSIQAEMAHYALFSIFRKVRLEWWLFTLIGIGLFFAFIKFVGLTDSEGYGFLDGLFRTKFVATAGFFLLGIWISEKLSTPAPRRVAGIHLSIAVLLILAYVALASYVGLPFGEFWESVLFVSLALAFANYLPKNGRVAKVCVTMGKYSYFIYFMHFFVLWILNRFVVGEANSALIDLGISAFGAYLFIVFSCFIAACLVSLAFSIPSWRFIEQPIIVAAKGR